MDENWPGNNIPQENAYKSPKEDVYSIDLKPLQANGGAADAPGGDEDDDFGEFGGFEAADPVPPNVAQSTDQAEASSSSWALYASGGGTFRQPDLLCAQNAFPQYLDPSGISGAPPINSAPGPEGGREEPPFQANFDQNSHEQNTAATDQARIAENVLDGTLNASTRSISSPEVAHSPSSPAPLPDLGLGGSRLPLMRDPSPDSPAEGAAAPVVADHQQPPAEESVPQEPVGQASTNESRSGPTDENVQAAKEENTKLKRDLESLTAQNKQLEDDLTKTRTDLEQQRSRMADLQERHVRELEEVKKAGHDALTVVVAEYKELSRTAVLEQQEVSLQHLQDALKQQAECYQQMMQDQAQEIRTEHETELKQHEERSREALDAARREEQEKFDGFMVEEREKHTAQIQQALEAERESSRKLMEAAIAEEQEKAEKKLEKEREKFDEVAERVKESCSKDLKVILEEERTRSQGLLSAAVEEERERGRESVKETQKSAREDVQSYIQEQRQHDSILRQRHLTSLDLFLASARQQLQLLMDSEKDNSAKPDPKQDEEKS